MEKIFAVVFVFSMLAIIGGATSLLTSKKWLVSLITGLVGTISVHAVAYFIDDGFDSLVAISILTIFVIGLIAGSIMFRFKNFLKARKPNAE